MARRNPDSDLVSLSIGVDPGSRWQIDCELTPEELQAIGLITVQWAHLEHCLLVRTKLLAESSKQQVPTEAVNPSFTKRLRAFRELATHFSQNEDEKNALLNLADRIANAEGQRHTIAHALWDWDDLNEAKLVTYSFRKPFVYERPFDLPKLQGLGKRISELLADLCFPDGVSIFDAAPYGSRFMKQPWTK